jgi:hypothetical protein
MRAEALSLKPGHVGVVAFSRSGDPATGDFSDAKLIRKFGNVPKTRAYCETCETELGSQRDRAHARSACPPQGFSHRRMPAGICRSVVRRGASGRLEKIFNPQAFKDSITGSKPPLAKAAVFPF